MLWNLADIWESVRQKIILRKSEYSDKLCDFFSMVNANVAGGIIIYSVILFVNDAA